MTTPGTRRRCRPRLLPALGRRRAFGGERPVHLWLDRSQGLLRRRGIRKVRRRRRVGLPGDRRRLPRRGRGSLPRCFGKSRRSALGPRRLPEDPGGERGLRRSPGSGPAGDRDGPRHAVVGRIAAIAALDFPGERSEEEDRGVEERRDRGADERPCRPAPPRGAGSATDRRSRADGGRRHSPSGVYVHTKLKIFIPRWPMGSRSSSRVRPGASPCRSWRSAREASSPASGGAPRSHVLTAARIDHGFLFLRIVKS
jgi:hypothetical protein